MSYSFSASYGITREQWNQMTTREQDEFVWAQMREGRIDAAPIQLTQGQLEQIRQQRIEQERQRVEDAIQAYETSLSEIKDRVLSSVDDDDGSVEAYLDQLIQSRSEAFVQDARGNMPDGIEAVNTTYSETVRAKIPALLSEINALLGPSVPALVSDIHRRQLVQQSQAQLEAVRTAERLRAQHIAEITNFVVKPGGGIDLKKALRYLAEEQAEPEEGSFEDAARTFETWAGRVTPLMQDEALDVALRNRISAKFQSVRAAFDALGPDSRVDDRLAALQMIKDFEHVINDATYESTERHQAYEDYRVRVERANSRYGKNIPLKQLYEIDDVYEAADEAEAMLENAMKDDYIERSINEVMAARGINVTRYGVMEGSGRPWRLMFDPKQHKAIGLLRSAKNDRLIIRVIQADPEEFSDDPENPTVIKDMKPQDQATVDKVYRDQVEFCDFYKQFEEDLKAYGITVPTEGAGLTTLPANPAAAVEIHPHDYVPPTPSADAERRLRNRRQASQLNQREMR